MKDNGWNEYEKLVMARLKEQTLGQTAIEKRLRNIEIEIALLKLRAGLFGALAGTVPALTAVLYMLFNK